MKSRLSGLMDGELDNEDTLFDTLKRSRALRDGWQDFHLIGDALRGEKYLAVDITSRVMAELKNEPVVLAPRKSLRPDWSHSLLAMAATLAGVAVVGWVALAPSTGPAPNAAAPVAQSTAPPQTAVQQVAKQTVRPASRDMQEYLVAHQTQLSSLQFRGGTEYIRTVAASRMTSAK